MKREGFEEIVLWPLAEVGLKRAIYLINHNRASHIPKGYRQQIGILLSLRDNGWRVKERKQD